MFDFPADTKMVMFGMGCYWGVERLFWKQKGVYSTQGGLIRDFSVKLMRKSGG